MKGVIEEDIIAINFNKLIIVKRGLLDRENSDRLGEKLACSFIRTMNKLGLLKKHTPTRASDLTYVLSKVSELYQEKLNYIDSATISRLAVI